jgi:hypothetical protein
MKRILSLVFALAVAGTLAGCDRPAGNAGSGATSGSGSSATGSSSSGGASGTGGAAGSSQQQKRTPSSSPSGSSTGK